MTKQLSLILLFTAAIVAMAAEPVNIWQEEFYIDDSYYWPSPSSASYIEGSAPTPYYRHTRELIFVDDTTCVQHPDTVKMIIRER